MLALVMVATPSCLLVSKPVMAVSMPTTRHLLTWASLSWMLKIWSTLPLPKVKHVWRLQSVNTSMVAWVYVVDNATITLAALTVEKIQGAWDGTFVHFIRELQLMLLVKY